MKLYFSIILFVLANSLGVSNVWAAGYCDVSPSTPYTFNLTSTAVAKDLPVGSDIPGTIRSVSFSGSCDTSSARDNVTPNMPIIACYYGVGSELASMPGVYYSGVTGVGIALRNSAGQRVIGAGLYCDTRSTALAYLNNSLRFNYSVSMALVKISDHVEPGTLQYSNTEFGMGVYNTSTRIGSPGDSGGATVSYSGNVTVRNETCTVSNSSINVPLGIHSQAEFGGVGTTTKDFPFAINLNCDKDANVNIRIDGSPDSSGSRGVLALTKSSDSASGIGAQLLYNGAPITLQQEMPINSSTPAGLFSIPFTARYYQTQDKIVQGAANATATFTMIYY